MRKTISNGINRRAVYKFKCTGPCGKQKSTYVYDRAKAGMCLSCSKNTVDPNQSSLFPEGNFTQEHEDELKERNTRMNNYLDGMINDGKPMPLVVSKHTLNTAKEAGIDTSNMVENQPVPTLGEFVDKMKQGTKRIFNKGR